MSDHDFPIQVLPIYTLIDDRTFQIGICDRRTGEMLDCTRYHAKKTITLYMAEDWGRDFRDDLIRHGVI